MFTNTYLPHVGGVARSVQLFTEDQIGLGHRVLVVAPSFPGVAESAGDQPEVIRVPAIQQFNGSDFSVRIPLPFYLNQQIEKFVMVTGCGTRTAHWIFLSFHRNPKPREWF
jgi:1,2-diacylglycerol 3-alpha-glucosyltransferase